MRKFLRRLRHYYLCFGVRGLLFGIRERLSDRPSLVSVIPPGTKHPLYLRLKTSDLRIYGQVFVSREYEFELVRPPQVIVDAGANIGLASIYYAIRYPAAKVLALEPAYANFLMLEKNTAPYPNIFPIRAALWKENTRIELIDPGYGYWGFQTIDPLDREMSQPAQILDKVPALTVDRIMAEYGINYVDILKVDIEGSEREVFEQTPQWINQVGLIVIELHDRLRPGCSEAFFHATRGFEYEHRQGEKVFRVRREYLLPHLFVQSADHII